MEEQKKVPKDSKLLSDIIVKSSDALRTSSSLTSGKRIFMCGTTESNGIFFAIYNTVFNLTEYAYEDPTADSSIKGEVCKDIHVNLNTGHLLIVSQRSFTDSSKEDIVYVRGFSLDSKFFNNYRNGY